MGAPEYGERQGDEPVIGVRRREISAELPDCGCRALGQPILALHYWERNRAPWHRYQNGGAVAYE